MGFLTKQDWVAEVIRERIIVGVYRRGLQLKQADLAEELGVSITPVREALLTLEAEGYVRGLPHKGLVVPLLDPAMTSEILDLRLMLERELTDIAVPTLGPAEISQLQALQDEIGAALDKGDLQALRTANYRFHFRLYEQADRPQTLQFVRVLWAKYPFTAQDADPTRPHRMRAEHDTFLRRVMAGDRAGAVAAMLDHIRCGAQQIATSPASSDRHSA